MIESKSGQRWSGVLLLAIGIAGTAWTWYSVRTTGKYLRMEVVLPGFAVMGLAMLLFPMDVAKFRAENGGRKPDQTKDMPTVWGVMLLFAVAACGLNWWLLTKK